MDKLFSECKMHSVAVSQGGGYFCTKCGKSYRGNENEFDTNGIAAWSKWGNLGAGSGGVGYGKIG